ncbi:MAG: Holliday junction ATP-dependent DNA helicase RuvA [Parcubacteria group bacterium GW2011_GWA1_36_12]|nr:MAG: Holliday junction ATP-dependent DNA helicase RuvA [Parcubacteria group bacterium GW2011_GWA1_36_12]
MIAFLSGKIILKRDKFIILEVNNIGYKVFLSKLSLLKLPEIGETIKLFCFHNVKEDASDLYGFFTYDEMDFFDILMDIRGVGPKAALEISAVGPLDKIKDKILKQDENVFAGIPGIGSKKAMTIILELTGKIKMLGQKKESADEAENALVQLGFSKQQAKEALIRAPSNIKNTEERIKQALKTLGK